MPVKRKPKEMTAEQAIKEVQRIGPLVEQLCDRVLQTERMCRMLGQSFVEERPHEYRLKELQRRTNSISNALDMVKRHLNRYGNEFDREPYNEDPTP